MNTTGKTKNFGILASISWNSNRWQGLSTEEDLDNTTFGWVKKNRKSFDDLNFGNEVYPCEEDGTYIGHSPQLKKVSKTQSSYVEIVFFKSHNYKDKKNYIIGFYAFPEIGKFIRTPKHKDFDIYPDGNIKAKKEDITLFQTPVNISKSSANLTGILPYGKEIGARNFNYLTYDNVIKILNLAATQNPANALIKRVEQEFLTNKKHISLR